MRKGYLGSTDIHTAYMHVPCVYCRIRSQGRESPFMQDDSLAVLQMSVCNPTPSIASKRMGLLTSPLLLHESPWIVAANHGPREVEHFP